ncbi:MAG: adenylosuccinate lyase [Legionellales bacterium]|nr:adenylosuccinate lyase [Legionellales bacterium]|tara:strand:+ start:31669 stop:33042 length:1374 start_codon:yes stop_codon:yes gene_type:complete
MNSDTLTAINPIDGRYHDKTNPLAPYFSEFALQRYRTLVEIRWLQHLADTADITEIPALSQAANQFLDDIIANFTLADGQAIKDIEKTTNHDVKAVEYFLKQKFELQAELNPIKEFLHFACTSEDINNLAYGLMLKEGCETVVLPLLNELQDKLNHLSHEHNDASMLSRTHGQAATPTTMGKEMANFAQRLQRQLKQLQACEFRGKLNGAVGNFNAHMSAYPDIHWAEVAKRFVETLGLQYNTHTSQIENHDYIAEIFAVVTRANCILVDFARDVWGYISLGYFKQKTIAGEVGSSTMPHKVNPIDFENAEGNLLMANSIMTFLSQQLPTSRWQRDLVDSTLMRNLGVAFGYSLIAYQSLVKGINKLEVNATALATDLENNWEVLGEAIQTVMRRYGIDEPYEKLKALTRGKKIDAAMLHAFIDSLELPNEAKQRLQQLTPAGYIGLASQLAKTQPD